MKHADRPRNADHLRRLVVDSDPPPLDLETKPAALVWRVLGVALWVLVAGLAVLALLLLLFGCRGV